MANEATPDRAARSISIPRLWALVLLASLTLYWFTAQRGANWQDSGMHQWRVLTRQWTNPMGLALAHPLYIAIGQPLAALGGEAPTWLTRGSGVGMALAVANVFLLGYWLTGRRLPGVLAAAMLAVAHTPWWLATISETYTWVAAGLTTELVLLVWLIARPRWWKLTLLALVSGLGFALHNLALLPVPVYAASALVLAQQRRLPAWALATAAGAWLLGAAPYLALIVAAGAGSGNWPETLRSALFGQSWEGSVRNVALRPVAWGLAYIALNWPFLSLLPVLLGWGVMGRHVGRFGGAALGAVAAIELIFAIRYDVPDQFMFLLPTHVMLAVGAAVGIDRILAMRRPLRRVLMALVVASLLLTPVLYAVLPTILHRAGRPLRGNVAALPGRDETRYWLTPWKAGENSAHNFAAASLQWAAPQGLIVADRTSEYPLRIVQRLYRLGEGVQVMSEEAWRANFAGRDEAIYLELTRRPIYFTPRVRAGGLPAIVRPIPAGPLGRLVAQRPGEESPSGQP